MTEGIKKERITCPEGRSAIRTTIKHPSGNQTIKECRSNEFFAYSTERIKK